MKKIRNLSFGTILLVLMMICLFRGSDISAATGYASSQGTDAKTIGGVTFTAMGYQKTAPYNCKIVMEKNGKSTVISKKATSDFVTNGKILYYVEHGKAVGRYQYKNTIYQYTVASGKKKKIKSGTEYTVKGCSGNYLYYGKDEGPDGVFLYALNLKTKKTKFMVNGVGNVYLTGSRVVTSPNYGDADNAPCYTFKLDGSNKKKLADGCILKTTKSKVYYFIWGGKNFSQCKVYVCSPTGKNKKAVTGWIDEIPQKYRR